LFGVDDGPQTLEESLDLCRLATADGITVSVVTPHIHPGRWDNTSHIIERACVSLQSALRDNDIPLQLRFAAEVRLSDAIPQQCEKQDIPFYGEVDGYNIMLLEFPHSHLVPGSEKLAKWLLDHGIRPLIAHPERNRQIMRDASLLEPFLDMGCWLQVTAGAVLGDFGERAKMRAHHLLDSGQVTVLASDGHNAKARPPLLRHAFDYVAEKYGSEVAARLMVDNPAKIIGEKIQTLKSPVAQRG
jgi:protein-tyrosine phosphatase